MAFSLVFLYLAVVFTTNFATTVNAETEADQCTSPTMSITVEARSDLSFNVSTITLPKNTCVKITLVNSDTSSRHDFVVDAVDGWDGIDIDTDMGETSSQLIQTPDKDLDLQFYCSVPGHREAGMEGTLKIGDTGNANESGSPGFGFVPAIFALLAILAIPIIRRK